MLVALPIVAGPILLITCIEHGTAFGARAASSALLGLVSLALFTLVLAWASRAMWWLGALVAAWVSCLAADVVLSRLTIHPGLGLLVVLGSAWTVARLLPADDAVTGLLPPDNEAAALLLPPNDAEAQHDATPVPAEWPWWDLPGRAAATAALVLTVTTVASTVGPSVTGVLAPFPIATSVVAGFVLAQRGSAATVHLLRGIPRGLLGFSVFCFTVAMLIRPTGTGPAFVLAIGCALATQLAWQAVSRPSNFGSSPTVSHSRTSAR